MLDSNLASQGNGKRISAAMIAKNEEFRIEQTIKSVQSLAERIYILDFGSEDRTVEIAKNLGVTVFETPEHDDRSLLRNLLLDQIDAAGETDFVLWLEPGEMFDFRTAPAFREFVESELESETAYLMVNRRQALKPGRTLPQWVGSLLQDESSDLSPLNPIDGFNDWNEETVDVRLMPLRGKRGNLRFSGRLRESVLSSIQITSSQLSAAPGRILDILPSCDPMRQRQESREILEKIRRWEEDGIALNDDLMLAKADALIVLSEVLEGRELYSRLIARTQQANIRLEAIYKFYATFEIVPPIGLEKVELLLQGLDHYPLDWQLLTFLGFAFFEQRNLAMAVRVLETVINHGTVSFDIWHRQCIREMALAHLSLLYRITGEQQKAIDLLENGIDDSPTHAQLARLLFDLYVAKRDEASAHRLAGRFWGDRDLDLMRETLTGACQATGGTWPAALSSLENAYAQGCRDPLCLRWYSLSLLANLKFEEALPILREWLKVEPGNTEATSFLFAASNPEHFNIILQSLRDVQARSIGLNISENFDGLILPEENAATGPSETEATRPQTGAPIMFEDPTNPYHFDPFPFDSPNPAPFRPLTD